LILHGLFVNSTSFLKSPFFAGQQGRNPMALDPEQIAEALPNYDIGNELGRGASGMVFAGWHRSLERPVAIKQLPRAFSADPEVRSRFLAEARVMASFSHPNVVTVHDYVEHEGVCLIVMELMSGGTVWSRFRSNDVTRESACAIVLACSAGLQAAHEKQVLHRDVKPENLMFSATGTVKVTDFGIAKIVAGEQTLMTRAGFVLGTPDYMAPEQASGGELTPATDVYALTTILYELIAGELPYSPSDDLMGVLYKHVHVQPVPLRDKVPDVSPRLDAFVAKGLAQRPEDRFSSAGSFGQALDAAAASTWGTSWRESSDALEILGDPRPSPIRDSQIPSGRPTVLRGAFVKKNEWNTTEREPVGVGPTIRNDPTAQLATGAGVPGKDTFDPRPSEFVPVADVLAARSKELADQEQPSDIRIWPTLEPPPRPRRSSRVVGIVVLVLLVIAGAALLIVYLAKPHQAVTSSVLLSGARLRSGDSLVSPNGQWEILMQRDGNLVEYPVASSGDPGSALWQTGTSGHPGAYLLMQRAGNLVIYPQGEGPPAPGATSTNALWASGFNAQAGNAQTGSTAQLENDSDFVVRLPGSGALVWQNKSDDVTPTTATPTTAAPTTTAPTTTAPTTSVSGTGSYSVGAVTCGTDPNFGYPTATGTITNKSSQTQSYTVDVSFNAGSSQVISGFANVESVAPGQTANFTARANTVSPVTGITSCPVSNVTAYPNL
jgi:serine/threonine protein kinase